jgi:uncharacterized membrane protein YbhN (UPF0104 family)
MIRFLKIAAMSADPKGERPKWSIQKRLLSLSFKIIISAVLLYAVLQKAGVRNVLEHFRSMNPWYFLFASCIYLLIAYLASLRLRLLLGKEYAARRLFSLQMIGSFFNNILPGAVGGDAVKIYYLYRESGKGGMSFGSVFLDRYLGVFARLSMGLVAGLFAMEDLKKIGMHAAIPLFFALFLAISLVVFRFRIGKSVSALSTFYDYTLGVLIKKRIMLQVIALSIVGQILLIFMIAVIALGMGQELSFTVLFILVPIILTLMAIPLSISGFGIREGVFVLLFGIVGIPASLSTSISFLWFLSMAFASLYGAVEYLRYRHRTTI